MKTTTRVMTTLRISDTDTLYDVKLTAASNTVEDMYTSTHTVLSLFNNAAKDDSRVPLSLVSYLSEQFGDLINISTTLPLEMIVTVNGLQIVFSISECE